MTYTIKQAGSDETITEGIEEFGFAREAAETEAVQRTAEILVVHAETGAVSYVTSVKAQQVAETGEYFTPWTRLENPKFTAPVFAGFVPAYTRKRITATVYRNVQEKGWRVHDGRTGNFRDVPNTKAACQLTSEMRKGLEL